MAKKQWNSIAKRMLKIELTRSEVTYEELARRLNAMNLSETRDSVAQKINRGTFPAGFLISALAALNCKSVSFDELE